MNYVELGLVGIGESPAYLLHVSAPSPTCWCSGLVFGRTQKSFLLCKTCLRPGLLPRPLFLSLCSLPSQTRPLPACDWKIGFGNGPTLEIFHSLVISVVTSPYNLKDHQLISEVMSRQVVYYIIFWLSNKDSFVIKAKNKQENMYA